MLVVQCIMLVVLLGTCMNKKTTNFHEPAGPEQWLAVCQWQGHKHTLETLEKQKMLLFPKKNY